MTNYTSMNSLMEELDESVYGVLNIERMGPNFFKISQIDLKTNEPMIVYRLYQTNVLTRKKRTAVLNFGGYYTVTTVQAIENALAEEGVNARVINGMYDFGIAIDGAYHPFPNTPKYRMKHNTGNYKVPARFKLVTLKSLNTR